MTAPGVEEEHAGGPAFLRVSPTCVVRIDELEWRFSASGGPGGQHVNTANTRAEVRFDIAGSTSLGPRQRARLLERFGPEVRVVASDERSQLRNRELALERLRSRLADALRVETPRRPTKPSKGAKERRLDEKRHRSETKKRRQSRGGRGDGDD
jgi:ribosome-associated protein